MRTLRRRQALALLTLAAALLADGLLLAPGAALAIVDPPTARWKLDDASGATAEDFNGTANGTVAGSATWLTSGAANGTGALRLDGTDDFVSIPSSSAVEPFEATITLWVRADPQHPPRNGDVVFEKGSFACNGPSFGLYVAATGFTGSLRTPTGQLTGTTADTAGANLWDGGWHFVSMDFRFESAVVPPRTLGVIYIDGGFAAQFYNAGSSIQTAAIEYAGATHSELVIGGPVDATCGRTTFKGDIDDVRLYHDSDIDQNAASQMPPETVVMSNLAAIQIHPGEQVSTSVDLSPAPRFGQVAWEYFLNGSDAGLCCYVNLNLSQNPTAHVAASGTGPMVKGTYEIRAYFNAGLPYSQSTIGATLTVVPWPSTTTVAVTSDPKVAYDYVHLSAHVESTAIQGDQYPSGDVKFWDTTGVTPVLLGTKILVPGAAGTADVAFDTNALGGGTHTIKAEYMGDAVRAGSLSSAIDVAVEKRMATVTLDAPTWPLEANIPFTIGAIVSADVPYAPDASLTFRKVGTSTPICTLVVAGPRTDCEVPGQPIGSPQFTVTYSGNTDVAARTSDPATVTVVADTARADNVGAQYTTFYPYKDSYKDTVAISGIRYEPISVTIKIYKPTGALYRTVSIPTGTYGYSFVWNGRYSTGKILAEGKYKVVQTLRDGVGNLKTVTSYVTLSKKHIVYTTKTITKKGSSLTAKGTAMVGGSVTIRTTSGYTKLSASTGTGQWAGAGWSLTLPSAAVYSSFYVRVYGRRSSGSGTVHMGAQQFRSGCGYSTSTDWNEACFGQFVSIPVTSGTTLHYYRTATLSSQYRSGTHVRVMVGTYGGTVYIYKAQVVVRYGYLTY